MEWAAIARRIDHAYLKLDADTSVQGLREAVELVRKAGLRSICVHPLLAGTVKKHNPDLRVCSVASYPLGLDSLASKIFAVQELLEQKVDEIDFVVDLFALLNNNWPKLEREAADIMELARPSGALVKAIIETPILSTEQIETAAKVLLAAGIGCIKTSTGFHREASRPEHIALLRAVVGDKCLLKASGGIRTMADVEAMLAAGADILGLSSTADLMAEAQNSQQRPA